MATAFPSSATSVMSALSTRPLRSSCRDAAAFIYAFDLIELHGRDLRDEPWSARREALPGLLRGVDQGAAMFSARGIVSKRAARPTGPAVAPLAEAQELGQPGRRADRRD
jgi:ATP-dependent DNA ligase